MRNGNPKHIKGWTDLVKPGVQVVTPNPFSSGSAKWNILAAYGAERRLGKTDKQATAYVKTALPARRLAGHLRPNATNTFLSGKGDVLITYESEALNSRINGKNIQYVIPRQTMLIELPIAVLEVELEQGQGEPVHPLPEGRRRAGAVRPVRLPPGRQEGRSKKYAEKYPTRPGIFKIDDKFIGGWRKADKVWFDPNKGRMVQIERASEGRPLASAATRRR